MMIVLSNLRLGMPRVTMTSVTLPANDRYCNNARNIYVRNGLSSLSHIHNAIILFSFNNCSKSPTSFNRLASPTAKFSHANTQLYHSHSHSHSLRSQHMSTPRSLLQPVPLIKRNRECWWADASTTYERKFTFVWALMNNAKRYRIHSFTTHGRAMRMADKNYRAWDDLK